MVRGLLAVVMLVLLSGCDASSNLTGSYVAVDGAELVQLNLVETEKGQINATFSMSVPDFEEGKISTITGGLTGVRNGSTIGLISSNGAGGSMTLVGTDNGLIWQVPSTGQSIVLVEMDQADYQRELVQLAGLLNANDVGLIVDDY